MVKVEIDHTRIAADITCVRYGLAFRRRFFAGTSIAFARSRCKARLNHHKRQERLIR